MKKENKDDEIETLSFDDSSFSGDTVEMLDFEADKKVSNEIDEMLDFIDLSEDTTDSKNDAQLEKLLETSNETNNNVEIDGSKEKLDEYKPSIKDFNIKNAKVRKIVKKSMLYVIIVMLLGFEFFINKTGDVLNSLRVYASDNQPIRIIQNNKYGYIDYTGNKIVNPKYSYGESFIKGYAIVKDSSNLPLIIDKGGKVAVPTGTYFSVYRAGTDIIASKVTKSGLKYGVLDANLKEKTEFKYDMITYSGDVYTFTDKNTVGLINSEGKEIFEYKLNDGDDKIIEVTASPVTDSSYQRYAVVTVNSSSLIVNINDGTTVSSATLNEITPEENNVFYESYGDTKRYMYVQDNKVLLESDDYLSLKIDSIETGVLKALTKSHTYEFISTKTLEQIKKNLKEDETYYGDNVFMYLNHNYKKNEDLIVMVKNGEAFKTINADFTVEKPFKNGIAIIKYDDGTYGYLNEEGNIITNERFIEAGEFDSYGEAIAKNSNGYGVINKDGKIIIEFENAEIKMASGEVKKKTSADDNVFYAVRKDNRYAIYKSNGKRANKTYYNDIEFNDKYPLFKASTDANDLLITSSSLSEINLTSFNSEYEAYDNYIILKNEYYNYKGKLIYVDNSDDAGKESGD